MPRPLRAQTPGAIYHVTVRGNNRGRIVVDRIDADECVAIAGHVVHRYAWTCSAYCVMTNHIHLVVELLEPNLAAGMALLTSLYARRFNRRHGRRGHLFESRYRSLVVETEPHFLETCRYVVLNPVRAGLCKRPLEWPWSSYGATAGRSRRPTFLAVDAVLDNFGRDRRRAFARYEEFVADGVRTSLLR